MSESVLRPVKTPAGAGPGQGANINLRLPPAGREASSIGVTDQGSGKGPGHRILVVDDNADAAISLAMLLELEGHETRVAHSGADALAAMAEFSPNYVFLDIGLPDLSGYEVARRMRAMTGLRTVARLIALTGWGSDEDRRQAVAAGFDAHLVKPVDPAELTAALR
jgi:CheY-like chemotaxis protein